MASDEQAAFVRQRRGLILISIVLCIVVIFGIEGTKVRLSPVTGSVYVDFEHNYYILGGLWVAWLWYLYRYWQYFLVVREVAREKLRVAQEKPLKLAFKDELNNLTRRHVEKEELESKPQLAEVTKLSVGAVDGPKRHSWNEMVQKSNVQVEAIKTGGAKNEYRRSNVRVKVKGLRTYFKIIRAVWKTNIVHPYFSEYFIAFLLAATPLVILIGKQVNRFALDSWPAIQQAIAGG